MRKIFIQILVFYSLFLLVFSAMRFVMSYYFILNQAYEELTKMFLAGLRMDLKTLTYIFLPLLLAMLLSPLFKSKLARGGGFICN